MAHQPARDFFIGIKHWNYGDPSLFTRVNDLVMKGNVRKDDLQNEVRRLKVIEAEENKNALNFRPHGEGTLTPGIPIKNKADSDDSDAIEGMNMLNPDLIQEILTYGS